MQNSPLAALKDLVLIGLMIAGICWIGYDVRDKTAVITLNRQTANIDQAVRKLAELKDERVNAILGIKP